MYLVDLFLKKKAEILREALELLNCAHLRHYSKAGDEENKEKLSKLLDLVIVSVEKKNLVDMISYVEKIAKERYSSGFNFHEVHAAFNVLEEVLWKTIMKDVDKEKYGEALGLVSTVLGAGKETLAGTFVSLASKTKSPTLDLSNLFTRK